MRFPRVTANNHRDQVDCKYAEDRVGKPGVIDQIQSHFGVVVFRFDEGSPSDKCADRDDYDHLASLRDAKERIHELLTTAVTKRSPPKCQPKETRFAAQRR